MSRSLSTNLNTETAKAVTTPIFLIKVGFSPTPLRVSTRGSATALSQTWAQAGARIERVTPFEAVVSFRNDDLSASALFLGTGVVEGLTMQVYQSYGAGPVYADADVVTLFDGVLDVVQSVTVDEVTIIGRSHSELITKIPRYRITELDFHHIPPTGTVITWGGEKITLTRAGDE